VTLLKHNLREGERKGEEDDAVTVVVASIRFSLPRPANRRNKPGCVSRRSLTAA
jgi:hypothetical protein